MKRNNNRAEGRGMDAGTRITLKMYAVLLLAVILVGTSGVTAARYITAGAGSQEARVARFVVDASQGGGSTDFTITDMQPGGVYTYELVVVNHDGAEVCEVATAYSINVATTGNLPLIYEIQGVSSNAGTTGTLLTSTGAGVLMSAMTTTGTWSRGGGLLPPGVAETHTYTITIEWPAAENDISYAGELERITLGVTAEQAA